MGVSNFLQARKHDMKKIFAITAVLVAMAAQAQDSAGTVGETANPLTISGYVEAYYSYDLNQPAKNSRPGFLYNFNRHNEFTLNLGFVKATYAKNRVRANLAVGMGTYMTANYAAEPGTLKNVYEGNAGYKLSAKKNWWLDVGILPSRIGFESATGKDNWALTRSLAAENSPYFESGARLSYTSDNGKLLLAALALNGWQRITRLDGASLMSFGSQVYYKPSDNVTLNYSTFTGTDKPDSARLWRYFHNVYGIFQLTPRIGLTAGFDVGFEDKTPSGTGSNTWYTPVAILRYTPSNKWALALRGEYYSDAKGVIIATGTPHGFKTTGVSLNIDYGPQTNVALRLEGRLFQSKDDIFVKGANAKSSNTAITFSTGVSF